jgi:6-phosphogluconolactonase (cycloisomerase 2 family)
MNRTYRALGLAACFVLCFSFLVGCGGGSGVTLTGVAVTPASASIAAGATQQFTATGMYSDNSTKDLTSSATWASATTSVATISGSGLATAVATGSSNITATAAGKTSAPATLTVTAPTVVSIAVTPTTASIVVGNTQQFTATATYSDKSTKDITSTAMWASGTPAVASISAAGLATGLTAGTSAITAASGGVTSSPAAILTVTATPVAVSLVVTPLLTPAIPNPTVSVGSTVPFTALELDNDGKTYPLTGNVTWTSGTTSVATIGGTNGIGLAVTTGTSVIKATEGSLTGTSTLTVQAAAARFAFNADFNTNLTEWSVTPATGAFTVIPTSSTPVLDGSQQILVHPSGHFVYSVSEASGLVLGDVNSTTGIVTVDTASGHNPFPTGGAGLSKAAIDPTGRFIYAVNDAQSAPASGIYSFAIDQSNGVLTGIGTNPITSSGGTPITAPTEILIDNTGNYVFVIDSGTSPNSTVYAFQINQTSGALTPVATVGSIPAGPGAFYGALDPTSTHLYTANTSSISVFTIASGALTLTATTPIAGSTTLECITIAPSGKFLYVTDNVNTTLNLYAFALNSDGTIGNATTGSPYTVGANAQGIAIDPTGTLLTVDNNADIKLSVFKVNADGSLSSYPDVPVPVAVGETTSISTFLTFYTALAGQ